MNITWSALQDTESHKGALELAISLGCNFDARLQLPSTTCSNCKDLITHCISLHYSVYSSILAPLKMMSLTRSLFLHVLTGILIEGKSHDNHLQEIYSACTSGCLQAGSIVLPAGTLSCRNVDMLFFVSAIFV